VTSRQESWREKVRDITTYLGKRLGYIWALAPAFFVGCWRSFAADIAKRRGFYRRSLLFIGAITLGFLTIKYTSGNFSKELLASYLVAAAAMLGGTIAIIFSISIFLLQSVAGLYSSKHLDDYANSARSQEAIYAIVIAITLALFAAARYVANISNMQADLKHYVVVVRNSRGLRFETSMTAIEKL
jgi:hypothetical protein